VLAALIRRGGPRWRLAEWWRDGRVEDDIVTESAGRTEGDIGPDLSQAAKLQRNGGLKVFRASRQEEILAVRDIALEYHAESRYAHIPFSERKFIRFFSKAISSPNDTLALYVQHNGRTVGLLNAGVGEYYLGEGGRMVTVYALYVSKAARASALGGRVTVKLIRILNDWAKAQESAEVHVHVTSGVEPERTDRLLRRLGYRSYGGNYVAHVG
jgi:hypothetical protein